MAYDSDVLVIHTSDWQIGMPANDMSEEARHRFRQARIDAVERLLTEATARGAAAVIAAGDLFDDNFLSPEQVERTLTVIARHDIVVIALPGNHDSLAPGSILARADLPTNLIVLAEPVIHRPVEGLEVIGAPWRSRLPALNPAREALAAVEDAGAPPADTVRVLVAHGQWRSYGPSPSATTLPAERITAALEHGLLDYVALGDHHSREVLLDGRVAYSGTPEVTAFDEEDPGWVLAVELEPRHAPRIEAVRIGRWSKLELVRTLVSAEDLEAIAGELAGLERPAETLVRLHVEGALPLGLAIRMGEHLDAAGAALAGLEVDTARLANLPDEEGPSTLGLSGATAEAYARLAELGTPEARMALRLLSRLIAQERQA